MSIEKLSISDNLTPEQHALATQWSSLASTASKDESFLTKLNDALRYNTYILGASPSSTDTEVFHATLPLIQGKVAEPEFAAANRHVIRWADLIQNTLVKGGEKLAISYDIEIPAEVYQKPKKEKKDAAKDAAPEDKKEAAPEAGKKGPKGKPSPEELAKLKAEKAAKKAAAKKEGGAKLASTPAAAPPSPTMLDLRVGFIEKAIKHPEADKLYVSTMNVGEEQPRTICSGLVAHYKLEEMQQRYVVVFCNLKKVKMRGIDSQGMVLCSSKEDKVEFVNPPPGSKPGDKIFVETYNGTPEKLLNPKKKIWETLQPHFTTDEDFNVIYKTDDGKILKLVNERGEPFKSSTIVGAHIS